MVFTVTGSYGTGSSAVTDLMKEYENICCIDRMEMRLLYDPDGISDLEYKLVENPDRHNTSHAVKKFMNMADMLDHVFFIDRYRKDFGDSFKSITKQYLKDITVLEYNASWHYDIYEKGRCFYVIDGLYRKIKMIIKRLTGIQAGRSTLISKNEKAYLGITQEREFLDKTKLYMKNLLGVLNADHKEHIIVDQLVPTSNIKRYIRYFDSIRVVLVERDPRDLYILSNEIWNNRVIPGYSVNSFCTWYRWTRELYNESLNLDSVLFIYFEDLIYDYEKTVRRLEDFFEIEAACHKNKNQFFNPQKSMGNTRLWAVYDKYRDDIKEIEQCLPEYLYKYKDTDIHRPVKRKEKIF